MQEIQAKAMQTFQNNLIYFSKTHSKVYDKLDILNQAIENGSYKERYALEYKNGYFDVLDTVTNQWLYGSDSVKKAKDEADSVNYKKNKGVIETFYNYKFDEKAVDAANDEDPSTSQFVTTAPVIGFIDKLYDKNTTMRLIYKFIFFGVGLGTHIEAIHKKIHSFMYLIIEDNLEIFRLSLFVTDYSKIANESELYFSIMESDSGLKDIFNSFFHNSFIRNNYIKYSILYPHYREKVSKIQKYIVSQSSNTYLQDKLLIKSLKVVESVFGKYNFFDISKHYEKNSLFSKRPLVLIAAGPSLGKEIKWLKENAQFVTVVSLFMATPILYKAGIKPDIIVHVDEGEVPVRETFLKMPSKDFFSSCIFLLSPSSSLKLFEDIVQKDKIFLFEDRTRYMFSKGFLEAFSVGEVAYALTLIVGAKELYLLGLDLALDAKTKSSHVKGHSGFDTSSLKKAEESDAVSLRGTEFFVKGNFLEEVPTLPVFDMSIYMVNEFTKKFKKDYQNIYNLSNGAYFNDTIPTRSSTVKFSNFSKKEQPDFKDHILSFFSANSSNCMNDDEKAAFRQRFDEAQKKKEAILSFSKQRYPSMSQFQEAFVKMASEIIISSNANMIELSQILIIYLENIGGYIGDFFNTVEINNPKRNIKHFQKIISLQLLKLVDKYMEIFKEYDQSLKD